MTKPVSVIEKGSERLDLEPYKGSPHPLSPSPFHRLSVEADRGGRGCLEGEGGAIGDSRSRGLFDKRGKPRLKPAQQYFLESRRGIPSFKELRDFYESWRDLDEYLLLQKQTVKGGEVEQRNVAVKCSKRGNDVYWWRVGRRLDRLRRIKNVTLFDPHASIKMSSVLHVTLTFDTKLCSLAEAWEGIGRDFNRWISAMRRKYGRISYFRDWEAFANGYPHVHLLMIFHDYEFRVFRSRAKYRVAEKSEFEIGWHSFVDVEAVRDLKKGMGYVMKYLTKTFHENPEQRGLERSLRNLTMAMTWIFRKQSFAVSGDFHDLICFLHNSNRILPVQVDLWGDPVKECGEWVFLGVFSARELGLDGSQFSFSLERIPPGLRMRIRDGSRWISI